MPSNEGESADEKTKRLRKPKTATVVFGEKRVIMECPFCGMTLVKSDYDRICQLLDDCDPPRGKVCASCGCIGILRLNSKAKEVLLQKLGTNQTGEKSQ
jgi:hypothetical protein